MDTGGLNNYMATISRDGRWVAAGTFTSDVKVGWLAAAQGGSSCAFVSRPGRSPACALRCPPLPRKPGPGSTSPSACSGPTPSRALHPSPLQLYEVQFDRLGAFVGVKLGMSLKGHKSKVFCLDFSPDLTKASGWQHCGQQLHAAVCRCKPAVAPQRKTLHEVHAACGAAASRAPAELLAGTQALPLPRVQMVTASGDGLLKLWNIAVRYHMDEDPKVRY